MFFAVYAAIVVVVDDVVFVVVVVISHVSFRNGAIFMALSSPRIGFNCSRLNPGSIVIKKSVAGFRKSKILTKLLMLKNLSYDTKAYFEFKDL